MVRKIKININGIYCGGCKTLIETEINDLPGVHYISVNCGTETGEIEFDDEIITMDEIFKEISRLNYCVTNIDDAAKPSVPSENKKDYFTAILFFFLLVAIAAYFLALKMGSFALFAELNETNLGYGLIFLVGLLASFHCVAMCGGLVVTYSVNNLEAKEKSLWPHFQYNLGRLISYAFIGGILGGLGSFFVVSPAFSGTVLIMAGLLMTIVGLSFLKHWSILERLKLKMPSFVLKILINNKIKAPFLIGLLNGFMPCGPLQAMQLFALTSGSFFKGFLSLSIFALGTTPLMFILGAFISNSKFKNTQKFLKISGLLIIFLGIIMLNRGLINFGYGYNGPMPEEKNIPENLAPNKFQTIKMDLTYYGYQPNKLYIKKGVPVRWIINAKDISECTEEIIIEALGVRKKLHKGENIIEFMPPQNADEFPFSCGMKMVWGKFIYKDNQK